MSQQFPFSHRSPQDRPKKQMSERLSLGLLLALSGGLMDAYSYLFRGQVFANAQTGNILLFSVYLTQGQWQDALEYLFPILAFSLGIGAAAIIRHLCRERRLHWRQICLGLEVVILVLVAPLPQSANLLANSLISLACGAQVESFRKIDGSSVSTTMCIGNLRSALHSLVDVGFTGSRKERHAALVALSIILAFACGAILGSLLLPHLGPYTLWTSAGLLTLCTIFMLIRPHPPEKGGPS